MDKQYQLVDNRQPSSVDGKCVVHPVGLQKLADFQCWPTELFWSTQQNTVICHWKSASFWDKLVDFSKEILMCYNWL